MQWWHPLVWKKIMVGLCLYWDRGVWWGKRLCIMVFWTMLLRVPLQPRGNIPIAANITFLEDSLGQYKKNSKNYRSDVIHKITHSNPTPFQSYTFPSLHTFTFTLFHSYTLSLLHSFTLTPFQSYTLPILHSSNSTLFQSNTLQIIHPSNPTL